MAAMSGIVNQDLILSQATHELMGTCLGWKPQRDLEIIASTPPGGGTDRAARSLLKAIEATHLLEVPAKVVNIPGDGGRKAWMHIASRSGDPHVLGINTPNNVTDVLTGLVQEEQIQSKPVAILYNEYIGFVCRSDSAIETGTSLLKRLTSEASKLTISLSTSLGNPNHIAVAKVIRQAGANVMDPKIRVFDSARDVVADVIAGQSDVGAITAASAVPEIEANLVRAIAVSSPDRLPGVFTSCPTWAEQKVDCVIGAWRGAAAPAGITTEQVQYWRRLFAAAVETEEWRTELDRCLWTAMYLDGTALDRHLDDERVEIKSMLGELGLLRAPQRENP